MAAFNRSYYFNYTSLNGWTYRLEIYDELFTGASREGKLGEGGCVIDYGTDGSELYAPFKPSTMTIPFVVGGSGNTFLDGDYIKRLRTLREERQVYAFLYRENVSGTNNPQYGPLWGGYMLFDLADEPDQSPPYIINLKCVDGLASLKYFDMIPPANTQNPNHMYEKEETFLVTPGNGMDKYKSFKDWIAKIFEYAGLATGNEGIAAATKFQISADWYNEHHTATTIDPLRYSRITADNFYDLKETDGVIKYRAKSVYEILKSICKTWGMRCFLWKNKWVFVQIGEYSASESGTMAVPDNIRTYTYNMDGTSPSTTDYIGTWWSQYYLYILKGTQVQKLEGGGINLLPVLKRVSCDFLQVSDINFFQKFPAFPDPYYTTIGWKDEYEMITTTTDFFATEMFYTEVWLDFWNSSPTGHDVRMMIFWTIVARAAGTTPWTHELTYDYWSNPPATEWQARTTGGTTSNNQLDPQYRFGEYERGYWFPLPAGFSNDNICGSAATCPVTSYIPGHADFTGDWELAYTTRTRMKVVGGTPVPGRTHFHGATGGGAVGMYTNTKPPDVPWGYNDTIPSSGPGTSFFSPVVAGSVGANSQLTSVTQATEDSAFLVINNILWGDCQTNAAAGNIQIWDGGAWVDADFAGNWGKNTLVGTQSLANLLCTEALSHQTTALQNHQGKIAIGLSGKNITSRPVYPNPISKFLLPSHTATGSPSVEWIMHTGIFETGKDEWSVNWYEYKYQAPGSTTTTLSTLNGINSGYTGEPATSDDNNHAKLSNPQGSSGLDGSTKKMGRDGFNPLTFIDETIAATLDVPISVTELSIAPIYSAVLKSGDIISVRLQQVTRNPSAAFEGGDGADLTSLPSKFLSRYQFTLDADQGASDTTLSVESLQIYTPIIEGSIITIDEDDLLSQYQNKTKGTIAGFEVDADGIEKGGIEITGWLDSDTMTGATANNLATAESIKAYVDSQTHTETEFLMAKCTAIATTSATNGEAYAVIIPFNTQAVDEGTDIIISQVTGEENNFRITSTTGTYLFQWNVAANTSVYNNRLTCGVKLQIGTYIEEGEPYWEYADIDPSHCYIYNRAVTTGGISRLGSTAGSILVEHNIGDTDHIYRLVFWKDTSSTATTKGITEIDGTQITIRKLT